MVSKTITIAVKYLENGNVCLITNNDLKEDNKNVLTFEYNKLQSQVNLDIGVSVDCITCLVLTDIQLRYFPEVLLTRNLKEIDISHNKFNCVPECIINSEVQLQKFNVSHNDINEFSSVPQFSKHLQVLDLSYNKLSDFPFWLFSSLCPNLENLNLSGNSFNSCLPFLSGRSLKKLSILDMRNCNFKSNYFRIIEDIPELKILLLGNGDRNKNFNSIVNWPKHFLSASTIVQLDLSKLGLTDLFEEICLFHALENLDFSYNYITWFPEKFSNLKNLQILNVSHNEFLSLPSDIDALKKLSELYISFNMIHCLPINMKTLVNLKILDCYSNDLIENVLDIINSMPSLEGVDLEQNSFEMNNEIEDYAHKKQKIRNFTEIRGDGQKPISIVDDVSSEKYFSSDEYEDCEQYSEKDENDYEEENWDNDEEQLYDDSLLVLTPFQYILVKKTPPCDPSDYIDPVCFEDALNDET